MFSLLKFVVVVAITVFCYRKLSLHFSKSSNGKFKRIVLPSIISFFVFVISNGAMFGSSSKDSRKSTVNIPADDSYKIQYDYSSNKNGKPSSITDTVVFHKNDKIEMAIYDEIMIAKNNDPYFSMNAMLQNYRDLGIGPNELKQIQTPDNYCWDSARITFKQIESAYHTGFDFENHDERTKELNEQNQNEMNQALREPRYEMDKCLYDAAQKLAIHVPRPELNKDNY